MTGPCSHLWEEGLNTSFVPEHFVPVHTLSFCVHTSRLWSDFSEFQNSTSDHVCAVSSVMYQRGLGSTCLRLHSSSPYPATYLVLPPLKKWSHPCGAPTSPWTKSLPALFPLALHLIPPRVHQFTSQPKLQHILSLLRSGHTSTLTPQPLGWALTQTKATAAHWRLHVVRTILSRRTSDQGTHCLLRTLRLLWGQGPRNFHKVLVGVLWPPLSPLLRTLTLPQFPKNTRLLFARVSPSI